MNAQCRWQKPVRDGQWAWEANALNVVMDGDVEHVISPHPEPEQGGTPEDRGVVGHEAAANSFSAAIKQYSGLQNGHVEGWCCRYVDPTDGPMGQTRCFQSTQTQRLAHSIAFMNGRANGIFAYDAETGKMCHGDHCGQFKAIHVHK